MPDIDLFARSAQPQQPQPTNGASPDGLGAYARPAEGGGVKGVQVPIGNTPSPDGLGAQVEWLEPDDVSPDAAVRSAGLTALVVAVATGVGLAIGGPWGAGAGLVTSGAIFNGYRAQKWWGSPDPSEKHEAVVSAVLAAFGLGAGAWMGYKAFRRHDSKDED